MTDHPVTQITPHARRARGVRAASLDPYEWKPLERHPEQRASVLSTRPSTYSGVSGTTPNSTRM